jgi:subtilisin family serine protease
MSLGGLRRSLLLGVACNYAHDICNVLIVAAAGNDGNLFPISYPARFKDVISVGAVDRNLNICSFSSGGRRADILAPGDDIVSTVCNQGYDWFSGTSMACPHVAGVAALYFSEHPYHGPDLCKSELLRTAMTLPGGGKLLNAAGAVGLVKNRSTHTPIMSKLLSLFPNVNKLFEKFLLV